MPSPRAATVRTRRISDSTVAIRVRRIFAKLGRAFRVFWATPPGVRIAVILAVLVLAWAGVNWVVQVWRKPAEMFFPVAQALVKSPASTWQEYGPLFREHSTHTITPELLAALAQVEGSGSPVALPQWTWRWSRNPFEWYRPASSAVGMFQITDAAFRDAKRYCIHYHEVVQDGPWYDLDSCWFNGLYTRVLPSHAIEMTSALLHRMVAATLARKNIPASTLAQKQDLAAVIHLCGGARGEAFARRGFQPAPGERCGRTDLRGYLAQVNLLKRRFAALAAGDK